MEGVQGKELAEKLPDKHCIATTDHMTSRRGKLDLGDRSRVANEHLKFREYESKPLVGM